MKRVLVSGGAGYIGNVLVKLLLRNGFTVRVIDNLRFGGESLLDLLELPEFEFSKGDITNESDARKAVAEVDAVVHLASIVGDPACAKDPDLARKINFEGTKQFYSLANEANVSKFIFASTCSNYGKMKNPECYVDETSEIAPVSLYAELKVNSEAFLLSQDKNNICKPTCLRFATAFGLSARPRFDLTVNEFTKELSLSRELIVFGEQFWRPYCHVVDISRAIMMVLLEEHGIVANVFNVGSTKENYQKQGIVDEIRKFLPEASVKYVKKNEDPRDYKVDFSKISKTLGFSITKTVPDGIKEIISAIRLGLISDPDSPKYKNI